MKCSCSLLRALSRRRPCAPITTVTQINLWGRAGPTAGDRRRTPRARTPRAHRRGRAAPIFTAGVPLGPSCGGATRIWQMRRAGAHSIQGRGVQLQRQRERARCLFTRGATCAAAHSLSISSVRYYFLLRGVPPLNMVNSLFRLRFQTLTGKECAFFEACK